MRKGNALLRRPVRRRAVMRGAAGAAALALAPMGAFAAPPVEEVAEGVFVHAGRHETATRENLGDIANIGFIVGGDAVAVIDTGGGPTVGEALRGWVRAHTDRPIRYIVNTHVHPDHILGNIAFAADEATVVGHLNLRDALIARGEAYLQRLEEELGRDEARRATLVPPAVAVVDRLEVDLGDRVLELSAHPTAHTNNDLTVLDRATGTLWTGDLLFRERMPSFEGSAPGWLAEMDRLEALSATLAVPGHGPAAVPLAGAFAPLRRYWTKVVEGVRAIQAAGGTMEDAIETVALDERDAWRLFDVYHARNVTLTFAELEWE